MVVVCFHGNGFDLYNDEPFLIWNAAKYIRLFTYVHMGCLWFVCSAWASAYDAVLAVNNKMSVWCFQGLTELFCIC